ncbi:hypothetical protein [Azospirillum argentinense]
MPSEEIDTDAKLFTLEPTNILIKLVTKQKIFRNLKLD